MRKKFIKCLTSVITMVLSVSILTGCGNNSSSTNTNGGNPVSTKVQGEKVEDYEMLTTVINSYQPAPAGHGNPGVYGGPDIEMDPFIFDYLCDYSPAPSKTFKPSLLESYEFADNSLTLKLKEGLKWSDGSSLTIDDVLTSFYMEIASYNLGKYASKIEKVDELTAKLSLVSDSELLLDYTLKTPIKYPAKVYGKWAEQFKAVYENMREFKAEENIYVFTEEGHKKISAINEDFHKYLPAITEILCSGPYVPVSTNSAEIVFEKNEHYRIDVPIKKVKGMRQVNLQSTTAAVVNKEFDIEQIGVSLELHEELMKKGDIKEVLMPEYGTIGYSFNINKYPTDIPEVRKAISYAIDKETIAPISEPGMVVGDLYSCGLPPSIMKDYADDAFLSKLEKYEFNQDKATELLKSIGWKKEKGMWVDENGKSPEIVIATIGEWTAWLVTGEAAAEMLKEFGFNVVFKPMEMSAYYEFANSGNSNMACDSYQIAMSTQHPYEAFKGLHGYASRMGITLPANGERLSFENPETGEIFPWDEKTEQLFNSNDKEEVKRITQEFMQFSNDMVLSVPITEKYVVARIHNPRLSLAEATSGEQVFDYYWAGKLNYAISKMMRDEQIYFVK